MVGTLGFDDEQWAKRPARPGGDVADPVTVVGDAAAIAAGLADNGVYVDPGLATVVTNSDAAGLATTIKGANPPIFLVAVPLANDGRAAAAAADQIHGALGRDGIYIVSWKDGKSWDLSASLYGVEGRDAAERATFDAYSQHPRDLAAQLRVVANDLTHTTSTIQTTEQPPASPDTRPASHTVTISVSVLVILAALAAAVGFWWRRRRAHSSHRFAGRVPGSRTAGRRIKSDAVESGQESGNATSQSSGRHRR